MKNIYIVIVLLITAFNVNAQNPTIDINNWCTTPHRMNAMNSNPAMLQSLMDDEATRQQEAVNGVAVPKGTIYKIPIVFHVLHNGGPENTTEEQIFNALDVINRDLKLSLF